jgi:hypothetical protein
MVITVNVTLGTAAVEPPPVVRVKGFRGLHRIEGGRQPAPNSPGVIPPYSPTVKLMMTKDIQLMSYDLAAHFHPAIAADRNKWRIIHGGAFAMNNGPWNGYDHPTEPHPLRDYINNRDLDAPHPYYDKGQRTFAGSLITGKLGYSVAVAIIDAARLIMQAVISPRKTAQTFRSSFQSLSSNNVIWCEPGVDAIDARNFSYVPGTPEAEATLENILAQQWIGYGVAEGDTGVFKIRPQWGDGFIAFPFILDRAVSFESRFFAAWDETYYPEPLKVYL